jgi:hypothetical protein
MVSLCLFASEPGMELLLVRETTLGFPLRLLPFSWTKLS